jgi:hypothetical protein
MVEAFEAFDTPTGGIGDDANPVEAFEGFNPGR